MKKAQDILLGLAGLVMLAALGFGLAAAFRALSEGGVPGAAEDTPRGYPPPQGTSAIAMPDAPATRVPGYPPPLATLSETEAAARLRTMMAEERAAIATQEAEATAHIAALLLTPSPGPFIGPHTFFDSERQFSVELLPGWRGWAGGTTVILNYDDETLSDVHTFPPGGLKIQIGVGKLEPGQSFEQWLAHWIYIETTPPESDVPTLSTTEPQPYTLGRYTGVTYEISGEPDAIKYGIREIVLPLDQGQIIVISLTPSDSPALPEALAMLSTLRASASPPP